MDINVARTFLEVVKTGSFVNAAANLNLTQTAVSARIRVLEQNLDRTVFIRNKAGARLTPAGEQFFRFATSLVQVWDRARRAAAVAPGSETVVTIGAELSQWNPLMRHWLVWMRRECPEIAISAYIDSAERLMEQVQEGSLDVAILYAAPVRPGVVAELLFEERLVLVRTTSGDRPIGTGGSCEHRLGRGFRGQLSRRVSGHRTRRRFHQLWTAGARLYARARRQRLFPDGGGSSLSSRKVVWSWCPKAPNFLILPIWSTPPGSMKA